jgi:hypothetical protein
MRFLLPLVYCGLALFLTSSSAYSASRPQTILIGLDLSASNPLVKDDNYASRVAARVAQELEKLPLKSRVLVRTFGNYDTASNTLKVDQVITTTAKPENVALAVGKLISNLPKLVREKKLSVQGKTNIVPFLETMSKVIKCNASVKVILATDGFEDSDYAKLTRNGGKLPLPATKLYPGCKEMLMLGIGSSAQSPMATKRLQDQWGLWANAAGFKKFTGLYDW